MALIVFVHQILMMHVGMSCVRVLLGGGWGDERVRVGNMM